jgi:hypothetical protein
MTAWRLSASRSANSDTARTGLRTTHGRRPPRRHWELVAGRVSLWPPTTRPPRKSTDGWGSGSRRPVETVSDQVTEAGRTAAVQRR